MTEKDYFNLTEAQIREIEEAKKRAIRAQSFPKDCKHPRPHGEWELKLLIDLAEELGLPFEKAKVVGRALELMQTELELLRARKGEYRGDCSSCDIGRGCINWEQEHLGIERNRSDLPEKYRYRREEKTK